MPLTNIDPVIFKLKEGVSEAQLAEMRTAGEAMLGKVPGLQSFQMGGVLASTAHRAKGFDMGLMTVMDDEQSVLGYATHPAHLVLHKLRESLCTDTLVYDMVVN